MYSSYWAFQLINGKVRTSPLLRPSDPFVLARFVSKAWAGYNASVAYKQKAPLRAINAKARHDIFQQSKLQTSTDAGFKKLWRCKDMSQEVLLEAASEQSVDVPCTSGLNTLCVGTLSSCQDEYIPSSRGFNPSPVDICDSREDPTRPIVQRYLSSNTIMLLQQCA